MNYEDYVGFKGVTAEEARDKLRSSNGVQYTEALFEETISPTMKAKGVEPIYSLKEFPTSSLPSAYQIYMNSTDEIDAAQKLVGSLGHWRKLVSLNWFLNGKGDLGFDGILQWRKDMFDRDRSSAKMVLMKAIKEGNINAAKALDKMASDNLQALAKPVGKTPNQPKSEEDEAIDAILAAQGKQ